MVTKMTTVDLLEWESKPVDVELTDAKSRQTAETLSAKGVIDIEEMKNGVRITANSYVGKITIGDLQINVYPKPRQTHELPNCYKREEDVI